MKKALFICCILLASLSHAHESFFAFAEVEYDDLNGRIEATISMTSHDLEKYLQERNFITKGLSVSLEDSVNQELISLEILRHFYFTSLNNAPNNENVNFKLEGYEIYLNGKIDFYFSAEIQHTLSIFKLTFDLLMDEFPEQQNKLLFIYRNKKRDYIFLPASKTQLIEL